MHKAYLVLQFRYVLFGFDFMKTWYVVVSILLFCSAYFSVFALAKSSKTFSAGVIAQEQHFPIKELKLGNYARCTVISAQKEDAFYSACYLKREQKSNWIAESAGARCEIKCESYADSNGNISEHYFTTLK